MATGPKDGTVAVRDGPSAAEVDKRAEFIVRQFADRVDDPQMLDQIRYLAQWAYRAGVVDGTECRVGPPSAPAGVAPQSRARSEALDRIRHYAQELARTYVWLCWSGSDKLDGLLGCKPRKPRKANRAEVVHVIRPRVVREWRRIAAKGESGLPVSPSLGPDGIGATIEDWLKEMPDARELFDARVRSLVRVTPATVGASKRRAGV